MAATVASLTFGTGIQQSEYTFQYEQLQKIARVTLITRRWRPPVNSRKLHITNFTHDSGQDILVSVVPLLEDESSNDGQQAEVPNPEAMNGPAVVPQLQVQTPEQQAKIAATPAHPESLRAMYATYVAACFMERVWRFGLPVVLSLLYDNLLPVAILSFVGQLVIFAGGPLVGALMDSKPRVLSFNVLCGIQTVCMLLSAGVVVHALRGGTAALTSTSGLVLQPWFLVLIVAGAMERLTGLAAGVAFERDWVVLLAGSNRSIALANANAILRRVDLMCEIAGPLSFGLLLSKFHPITCICLAAAAMAASLPLLIFLVDCTYKHSKGVLDRPRAHVLQNQNQSLEEGLEVVKHGWVQYLAQPILPASLAYVLLYFNAVLGPGSLMTSFLTQRGLNPSIIGAFRGSCALMGLLATFVSSSVIRRFGVLKAGLAALIFQAAGLFLAVGVYWTTQMQRQSSLIIFLVLVVISRLGFWVYDMVDAQIFQTAVPASQANLVGTTEISLASLAELVMMGVAIVANDVAHYGSLAALSVSAVAVAAVIYWNWSSKAPNIH